MSKIYETHQTHQPDQANQRRQKYRPYKVHLDARNTRPMNRKISVNNVDYCYVLMTSTSE